MTSQELRIIQNNLRLHEKEAYQKKCEAQLELPFNKDLDEDLEILGREGPYTLPSFLENSMNCVELNTIKTEPQIL